MGVVLCALAMAGSHAWAQASWNISGTITNGAGATVTLAGGTNPSTAADSSGNYSFTGLSNGTYTVTPSETGLAFTPASQQVTVNGADVTGVNFTAQVPASIPHDLWSVLFTDSQETSCQKGAAGNAIDGNPGTMWVTQWCPTSAPLPHEIQINLGASYYLTGFEYLPRQDGCANGWIKQYEFYVSADGVNWGTAVATGTFNYGTLSTGCPGGAVPSAIQVNFPPVTGQYVRLRALSEINGHVWTAAAEIGLLGAQTVSTATYSISGTITPAANGAGATVTLSGAASATTTADGNGNYTISGLANGAYAVTPSKIGFAFSPVSQAVTVNGADQSAVNFSAAPQVAVSISPSSAWLVISGTQQFTATVTGTTNTAVSWSVSGGSASSTGLYSAPATGGTYTVTATSVADSTKSASATVNVTSAISSDVLLGDQNVESETDSLPAGQAAAFQATARASGNLSSLVVYLDASSTVSQLLAGLYADASGHPGALLSQGSNTQLRAGAWNSVSLPATSLVAGTQYWIAILGTSSGTLAYRDTHGGCPAETSSQSSLTSLATSWTTGATLATCPASIFGDSANIIFFDDFPGTSLSPFWTIISRHGEYSQDETECNIPQQVAVANGLSITTAAQTWVCGDFNPDGTVWHTPSSWPYITGDIQWTNLNFTYGTVEIRAKFPDQRTSLWPATWLLGSNCQSTNPFTGETGVGNCADLGSAGYTEIDMTECYGSGWCQFHVANPDFGIGNGCDGVYNVDTNFHTFTTAWTASGITQYMDGVAETTCNQRLRNPMFLIIQTQTGGAGGTPNNAFLPAVLGVDYVKVTQP